MSTPRKILVADDNLINQTMMRKTLEYAGYEVEAAFNGVEVIDLLNSGRYDLVIMDCLMPVMDGFTATSIIRSGEHPNINSSIPIIATTALAAAEDRKKCLDSGMNGYMSKPIDAAELFDLVDSCLANGEVDESAPTETHRRKEAAKTAIVAPLNTRVLVDSMHFLFIADAEQWQLDLETLSQNQAFDELADLAHKIRGTADLFEDRALSELAELLEHYCKAGEGRQAKRTASRLSFALQKLVYSAPAES